MGRDSLLLQIHQLLSQRLSKIEPFLRDTACLHPEEREITGYIEAYIRMFGKKNPFSEFLLNQAKPAIEAIGMSKWQRTELTDLGLRISDKETGKTETVPSVEEEEVRS